ncbi:MAG: VWA domain-containing protein [Chloroflexi bacterium]|nr:VWA domain-containing protein [Chloroflexota bacterium]
MKRILFFSLLLMSAIVVGVLGVSPSVAQTVTCPPCPTDGPCPLCPDVMPIVPGVFTNPEWLKIDHHRVRVEVDSQIARTSISMEFVNEGNGLAEGTFIFPLPQNASVEQLIMYINDQPIEAKILDAREARAIYDEIVRQYRDPALLEYIGTQAVQANVFPIPPGESRGIEIIYSQVLEVDNGLIQYVYPMDVTRLTTTRPIEEASISVRVSSNEPVSNIYSPSHNIAIHRAAGTDREFTVGWEQSDYVADQDFSLYWGIASETINLNLLTHRAGSNEDGYFMVLVQPPLEAPQEAIVPRDLIIVLDQSGSMDGEKWNQAREAAAYVLQNLNEQDRFNVVLFSTGWRTFSDRMESPAVAQEAVDWLRGMFAEGGTNIDGALETALEMVGERPTTILFMTDGLATEGETSTSRILENVAATAPGNIRLFTFGVGDDVDTFLLDSLVREHRGASSYVRPTERIDEEVQSLYNKIGSPVMTDLTLSIDGVRVDAVYPQGELPDLFAGNQLTIVGRYRDGVENATISLTGMVGNQQQTFTYSELSFRDRAGGDSFVARLWATRRIADLLNSIRLNGENRELVDSIVSLSIRFGIITPYTSFLIEEDDILSQQGRVEAEERLANTARDLGAAASGAAAVDAADQFAQMSEAAAPMAMPTMAAQSNVGGVIMPGTPTPQGTMPAPGTGGEILAEPAAQESPIQTVGEKTFILQSGVWTDTTYEPDTMTTEKVEFLSDAYFDLLAQIPELGEFFALGDRVIVVWDGVAYEVTVATS